MPLAAKLPQGVNFDKVVEEVLRDMANAYKGWTEGFPRDEVTLMSRVTEHLMRNRRKCDIGTTIPMHMESHFHELHRQGKNQVDQFGADVAVTVRIPSENWVKTCFFQFKVVSLGRATLELRQLKQAAEIPGIEDRSFVLAVDESKQVFRVEETKACRNQILEDKSSKVFDLANWRNLSDWLLRWFKCMEGKPSIPEDADSVEALLEEYKVAVEAADFRAIMKANLPTETLPAKAWMEFSFEEND